MGPSQLWIGTGKLVVRVSVAESSLTTALGDAGADGLTDRGSTPRTSTMCVARIPLVTLVICIEPLFDEFMFAAKLQPSLVVKTLLEHLRYSLHSVPTQAL